MITVTLIYEDGTHWFAGGFNTMDQATAWVENEKIQPYWNQATEVQIVDNTPPPEGP